MGDKGRTKGGCIEDIKVGGMNRGWGGGIKQVGHYDSLPVFFLFFVLSLTKPPMKVENLKKIAFQTFIASQSTLSFLIVTRRQDGGKVEDLNKPEKYKPVFFLLFFSSFFSLQEMYVAINFSCILLGRGAITGCLLYFYRTVGGDGAHRGKS